MSINAQPVLFDVADGVALPDSIDIDTPPDVALSWCVKHEGQLVRMTPPAGNGHHSPGDTYVGRMELFRGRHRNAGKPYCWGILDKGGPGRIDMICEVYDYSWKRTTGWTVEVAT